MLRRQFIGACIAAVAAGPSCLSAMAEPDRIVLADGEILYGRTFRRHVTIVAGRGCEVSHCTFLAGCTIDLGMTRTARANCSFDLTHHRE